MKSNGLHAYILWGVHYIAVNFKSGILSTVTFSSKIRSMGNVTQSFTRTLLHAAVSLDYVPYNLLNDTCTPRPVGLLWAIALCKLPCSLSALNSANETIQFKVDSFLAIDLGHISRISSQTSTQVSGAVANYIHVSRKAEDKGGVISHTSQGQCLNKWHTHSCSLITIRTSAWSVCNKAVVGEIFIVESLNHGVGGFFI